MPDNDNISSRIETLRFPLIVGVVFIHNYVSKITLAQGSIGIAHSSAWADFVRFFVSQGIARVAVPLFFLISGYLFFLGEWSWSRYADKLRRRVNTLLIPFLFWNLAAWAIYTAGRSISQTRMYFAGGAWPPAGSSSLLSYLGALFGVNTFYPIDYQFWFIRDLIALVLLAPAIHFLLRGRIALPFLMILFGLWFVTELPVFWPRLETIFFFCLGAYLSKPGKNASYLDNFGPWISAAFLVLVALYAAFPDSPLYLRKSVIVFGVPTLWWLTGLTTRTAKLALLLTGLSGDSFFIFAAHEPLQTVARKILYEVFLPASGAAVLTLYFLIPVCIIALLVVTHRSLLKMMPGFAGLITGNTYRANRQRG